MILELKLLNKKNHIKIGLIAYAILCLIACSNSGLFQKNQKVIFIGDSITKQGHFIKVIDRFLEKEKPTLSLTLINAGLNSETVSGLSEPIHHPPRPILFDRLDALLKKESPDIIFFCYGINDGIYHPYSETNFQKYKNGVARFLQKIEDHNLPVILLTPPPFALKKEANENIAPSADENYSWKNPYPNYDVEVIQKFRDYILSIKHPSVKKIINIYQPLKDHVEIAYGNDPIHPNIKGHQFLGETIINAVFNDH